MTSLARNQSKLVANPKSRRSRGRPTLKQVADIDRELLDFALREFLKKGYGGTSMAMIVKAAGISKTTLYSRYSSKEDLFLAIIRRTFESNRIADQMKQWQSSLSLEQGLKAYARHVLRIGMNEVVSGIDRLIYSEAHNFPELASEAGRLYDQIIETLTDFIAECARREGLHCNDPAWLAAAVIDLTRGFHVRAIVTNLKLTDDEIEGWADRAIDLLLHGLKGL